MYTSQHNKNKKIFKFRQVTFYVLRQISVDYNCLTLKSRLVVD